MRLTSLLILNSIVALLFGLGFVLFPGQMSSIYGITADAPLKYTGQLFGAALLAFAVMTWYARYATESAARRAIVLGLFVGDAVGFIVALLGQLGNVVNAFGWSTVAIYLILALGFGYFLISKSA